MAQVDAVAAHRDAFLYKKLALPPSHRNASIGADHAVPWEALISGGENATDLAGRSRLDVAVGADESNRNRSHPSENFRGARVGAVDIPRHGVYLVRESR